MSAPHVLINMVADLPDQSTVITLVPHHMSQFMPCAAAHVFACNFVHGASASDALELLHADLCMHLCFAYLYL